MTHCDHDYISESIARISKPGLCWKKEICENIEQDGKFRLVSVTVCYCLDLSVYFRVVGIILCRKMEKTTCYLNKIPLDDRVKRETGC